MKPLYKWQLPLGEEFNRILPNDYLRSPLQYPGGKNHAVKDIISYIPTSVTRLCSPFLGGGHVEFACTSLCMDVYAYDVFLPLVEFWNELLDNPSGLARKIQKYLPLSRERFYEIQKSYWDIQDRQQRAVVFYVLNRSSFSGTTFSGGMSPGHRNFTQSSIERIRNFRADNIHIKQGDFRNTLERHKEDFLYLDPPYFETATIYGYRGDVQKNFDHEELARCLKKRNRWLLSYNDCSTIRELYQGFKFITLEWKYGMSKNKDSNEVLIVSKDLT